MRFGSTAKVLAKCKLEYYRFSECQVAMVQEASIYAGALQKAPAAMHGRSGQGSHLLRSLAASGLSAGGQGTMRFGMTAKVLAKCKLKCYRISEYGGCTCMVILRWVSAAMSCRLGQDDSAAGPAMVVA